MHEKKKRTDGKNRISVSVFFANVFSCHQRSVSCFWSPSFVRSGLSLGRWCAFESSDPSLMSEHCRNHTHEDPFCCWHCGERFALLGTLRSHIVRLHFQVGPFGQS